MRRIRPRIPHLGEHGGRASDQIRRAMPEDDHASLLLEAIGLESRAHSLLLAGEQQAARPLLEQAAGRYRASWEAAPPGAFGRLIGLLKARVLAGDADEAASYAREQIGEQGSSPPSWYALAIAALVAGDDALAARGAEGMRAGSPPFGRAADAIAALAAGDAAGYAAAIAAIVADFESREQHLTGVPIADTALMLEALAAPRGLASGVDSPLLPR
jgi:hypothetical protein